ncbi:2-oxoglutarate carboxylase large subunit [compost metagenome]
MQGLLSKIFVKEGEKVKKNQPLFVVEAMKMETNITANHDFTIGSLVLAPGTLVNTDDLVLEIN